MENSSIAWTHNTQNFWVGCDKIAPECAKCYIGRILEQQGREPWGQLYRTKTWRQPFRWQQEAALAGVCRRVFTNSLSDFFHAGSDAWREEAWDLIRKTPNLIWLILTKRPELIASRLPKDWGEGWPNVWLGTSVGCNQTLNKMDSLRKIAVHPKAVRFVSCEPLLEDISVNIDLDGFGWVIVGGESGVGQEYLWNPKQNWREEFSTGGRRTMMLDWAKNLLSCAQAKNIPYFFKQVTSARPGVGEDALGRKYQEFPPPPHGKWAETPVKIANREQSDETKTITLYGISGWRRGSMSELESTDEVLEGGSEKTAQSIPAGDGVRAQTTLEFRTAAQIAAESPAAVEWIARPWISKGAITEVDGQVKAAGKTTWLTHMCRAILDGTEFMGEPTIKTPILYLTEQPQTSFRVALERAGLLGRKDLIVLFWNRTSGRSWAEVAQESVAKCENAGAGLLIVDTIAQFAGLVGDSENHSGDAIKAMQPLMLAAEKELGIVLVRHERKKGGSVGSSGRGSSAFSGAADIVLSIRRPEGNVRTTLREIHALSRFDETPDVCTIELTDKGYILLGESKDASRENAKAKILEVLPTSEGEAIPIVKICERTGIGRTSVQRILGELGENRVGKVGKGIRNEPLRYYSKAELLPAQTNAGSESLGRNIIA
jgi:protein gp37